MKKTSRVVSNSRFVYSKIATAILALATVVGIFAMIKDDQQKLAKCKMKYSADYCSVIVYGR